VIDARATSGPSSTRHAAIGSRRSAKNRVDPSVGAVARTSPRPATGHRERVPQPAGEYANACSPGSSLMSAGQHDRQRVVADHSCSLAKSSCACRSDHPHAGRDGTDESDR